MNGANARARNAAALCIWGTSSNVGKSLIAAGLGRLLNNQGYSVAPFKAQNMSNNSAVTVEGGEIGRAQACQAEACRIPACNDLNPLLLKPTGDKQSQVVLHGTVFGTIGSDFGMARIGEFKTRIAESYDRLASAYDVILIEGAGGCAELNLRRRDLANLWIAEYANASVLLVSDIERGGIFASLLGTLDLLEPHERERIVGLVVNKFRGASELFDEGVQILERRSGKPVLGVVPYISDCGMPEEDGASFEARDFTAASHNQNGIRVGVIMPNHASNITDVEALIADPRFTVRVLYAPPEERFDALVFPGSKNAIDDLVELKRRGFEPYLKQHAQSNGLMIGLCGGYQMLGRSIEDPHGVESNQKSVEGFSLLDVRTELFPQKITENVRGTLANSSVEFAGYEIHCGRTCGRDTNRPLVEICWVQSKECRRFDGAVSTNGRVWGTYVHGLFDSPGVRDEICRRFNGATLCVECDKDPYEKIASVLACRLDLKPIFKAIEPTNFTTC